MENPGKPSVSQSRVNTPVRPSSKIVAKLEMKGGVMSGTVKRTVQPLANAGRSFAMATASGIAMANETAVVNKANCTEFHVIRSIYEYRSAGTSPLVVMRPSVSNTIVARGTTKNSTINAPATKYAAGSQLTPERGRAASRAVVPRDGTVVVADIRRSSFRVHRH